MNLGGLTLREALQRTWVKINDHEIMTRAAAITFYAIAALVPFLALVILLAAYLLPWLTGGKTVDPVEPLSTLLPPEAAQMLAGELKNIRERPSSGLLSFGTIALLWLNSTLFVAVMDAMNRIMGVEETRPYWKQRLVAVAMTLVEAVILIAVLASTLLWPQIIGWLKLDVVTAFLLTAVHALTVFVMVLMSYAAAMYFAPDAHQRWEWITPGSLLGSLVLVCVSFLFRFYVQRWGDYGATYGSFAGVVVLTSWMWLCSVALLTVAEFNKVIEDASPYGKEYGQRHESPGTRAEPSGGRPTPRPRPRRGCAASGSPPSSRPAPTVAAISSPTTNRSAVDLLDSFALDPASPRTLPHSRCESVHCCKMTVRGRRKRGKGARGEVVKQEPEPNRAWDESDQKPARVEGTRTGAWRALGVLRGLADVREDEWNTLEHAGLFVFSLLAANYLIRPIRDEMGVAGGPENLPALFTGTLVSMLLAWPLLSAWLGRRGGRSSIGPILRTQQVMLLTFFSAFQLAPDEAYAWTARLFFVWASVTNLLIVSIAWGSLAGRFTSDQAHRLFGLIAAGGALGAIAGSALAGMVGRFAGPTPLMLPAVLVLEIGLRAGRRTLTTTNLSRATVPSDKETHAEPSRPNARGGFYLVCLGLWTLLFTTTSAFVYLEQARIVEASILDPAVRTAFFARIDLLVNVFGLAMQLMLTAWFLNRFGVGAAAAMLPAVTIVGMIALSLRPTVATVQWFQVARRAMDYAVARPSREVFYTVVDPSRLLRAKGLIDTAVYRAGDAAGAWAYGFLTAAPATSGAGPAVAVVALSVVWIVLSVGLGAAMNGRIARNRERNYSA